MLIINDYLHLDRISFYFVTTGFAHYVGWNSENNWASSGRA